MAKGKQQYLVIDRDKTQESLILTGMSCELFQTLQKRGPQTYEQLEKRLKCPRQSLYVFVQRLFKNDLLIKEQTSTEVQLSLPTGLNVKVGKSVH